MRFTCSDLQYIPPAPPPPTPAPLKTLNLVIVCFVLFLRSCDHYVYHYLISRELIVVYTCKRMVHAFQAKSNLRLHFIQYIEK